MKEKSAAILTIKDAPSMSPRGRKQIASWLRRQAGFLEKHSRELSHRFTARYLYGLILVPVLLTGCVASNFTEAIKAAGTANKEIDAEFSGWNAHMSYHSKPTVLYTLPSVPTNSGAVLVVPSTTLKVHPVQ